ARFTFVKRPDPVHIGTHVAGEPEGRTQPGQHGGAVHIGQSDRQVRRPGYAVETRAPVLDTAPGPLGGDHQIEPLPGLEPIEDLPHHARRIPTVHRDPTQGPHQRAEGPFEHLVLAEVTHPNAGAPADREHQHEVPVGGVRGADHDAGVLLWQLVQVVSPAAHRPVRARQRPTDRHAPNLLAVGPGGTGGPTHSWSRGLSPSAAAPTSLCPLARCCASRRRVSSTGSVSKVPTTTCRTAATDAAGTEAMSASATRSAASANIDRYSSDRSMPAASAARSWSASRPTSGSSVVHHPRPATSALARAAQGSAAAAGGSAPALWGCSRLSSPASSTCCAAPSSSCRVAGGRSRIPKTSRTAPRLRPADSMSARTRRTRPRCVSS